MEDVNQRQCLFGLEMDKTAYLLAHDLNDDVRSLNLGSTDLDAAQLKNQTGE